MPYTAKTIRGAQARVRRLERQLNDTHKLLAEVWQERGMLARLAATGPAFYNPLEAIAAEKIRDRILREHFKMAPDGRPA